ncbi:MAG: NAD-dependent epimerase/dehydratase family protein [Thermoanaerobaculia bacterium]
MDVIVFGATGMVGQGVVRECLSDPDVRRVVTVGRTPFGRSDPKLQDIVQADLFDLSTLERQLSGLDACFFCLGVSAAGMSEQDYAHLTYDLTVGIATLLARINPQMTFVYVSGAGTDSSEHGRIMWARVKGKTENALLRLPFKAAFMFRPGLIQPLHGIRSKTKSYRVFYTLSAPVLPVLKRLFPAAITTTEQVGRAMLTVAKRGAPKAILEASDINRVS